MKPTPKLYYPAIDGIRAIAVLAVVLFHLDLAFFSGGYVGVDVFFVISGFLITRNITLQNSNGHFSLMAFYRARFRRLAPALLVTILFTLLMGVLLYSPDALIRLSGSSIAGVVSLANIRFWQVSGYFDADSTLKPLLHLWSLSVEEQFYLIWPLLLLFCFRVVHSNGKALLILGLVSLLSFVSAQLIVPEYPATAFYWMPFRVYEFAFGGLLAVYEVGCRVPKERRGHLSEFATLFGLSLIAYSIFTFDKLTLFPGAYSLVPCVGTVFLLWSRGSNTAGLLLSNLIARSLGKVSYSFYLVHWPIWVFASFWNMAVFHVFEKIVLFIVMLGVALLLYFFVERRYRNPDNGLSDLKSFAFFSGLSVFIVSVAFFIRINSGFPQRVPEQPQTLDLKFGMTCIYPNGNGEIKDCELGNKSEFSKRALLIGDSHSMNLAPALNYFGLQNNISIHAYSAAGCAPLIGVDVYHQTSQEPDLRCRAFSNKLAQLIQRGSYDVVVISGRWSWYYEHDFYHETQVPPKAYLVERGSETLSSSSSRKVWKSALENTVRLANLKNMKVVLISQFPLLNKGIGECDKSPSYLIDRDTVQVRCSVRIPYSKINERLEFTNTVIRNLGDADTYSIVPSDYLCSSEKKVCDVFKSEGLLYFDDNHLSDIGGWYLINAVEKELLSFMTIH